MKNTVLDWMDLHGLSKPNIVTFLNSKSEIKQYVYSCGTDNIEQNLDVEHDPRCLVSKSLAWYFDDPRIEGILAHNVSWVSDTDSVPQDGPLTLHDTDKIEVYCCYRGSAADLIALAHEFGHALQLIHLNGRFPPPVDREICAFLGEHILLSFCEKRQPNLFPTLAKVWHEETKTYLGQDADSLLSALDDPQSPYTYRYNYPMARKAALELFSRESAAEVWDIFTGRSALSESVALSTKELEHVA